MNKEILQTLSKTPLFSGWDDEKLEIILQASQSVHFDTDAVIFDPSKIGFRVYLILSGSVIIVDPEKKSTIAEFVSGEMFGEMSFLTKSPQNAFAIATCQTEILEFPKNGANLLSVLAPYPKVVAYLYESFLIFVANRIRSANSLLKENSPIVQEFKKQMYTDKLTGLLNKIYLEEYLNGFLETNPSLIMMKPDNFKLINDSFGHEKGDEILMLMAKHLSGNISSYSKIIRYEGNAFAILTPNHNRVDAFNLASFIQNELHFLDLSSVTQTNEIKLSMSIGIALAPEHGNTKESLIRACAGLPLIGRAQGGKKILFAEVSND